MNENNVKEVTEEIRGLADDELTGVVEKWLETMRAEGLKMGARYISAAVHSIIKRHLEKTAKPSLRDYKRCIEDIIILIAMQLQQENTQQNDLEEATEEDANDGTAE